jgi:hypothetical protein
LGAVRFVRKSKKTLTQEFLNDFVPENLLSKSWGRFDLFEILKKHNRVWKNYLSIYIVLRGNLIQ